MSKLMIILGIIVAAAGAVTGALAIHVSPGQMQVLGLTPEDTAVLLIGGLGLIGIGGVICAVDRSTAATRALRGLLAGQEGAQTGPGSAPAVVSEFSTTTAPPSNS